MANVQMPDGTTVDMPDQLDPQLGQRLRAFQQVQSISSGVRNSVNSLPGQLAGAAEIAGNAIENVPSTVAHGLIDLYHRLTGQAGAPNAADNYHVPVGAAGQQLGQQIGQSALVQALSHAGGALDTGIGQISPTAQDVLHQMNTVVGDVGDVAQVVPVAGAVNEGINAARAAAAAAKAAAPAAGSAADIGLRATSDLGPVAKTAAGGSAQPALQIHHQTIGNTVAGSEAGVAPGTTLNNDVLASAREAPSAVYNRVAAALPDSALGPDAQAAVKSAGLPEGGRVSQGSPQAQPQIEALRGQLLDQTPKTGEQWVNELRGLRQEGYTNVGSDDVSNQQLGQAQLDMARAIEGHIGQTLPANADVDLAQFQAARTALAKNHAVQGALRGNDVDLQALARIQRSDPGLLSGGLQTLADFANENPQTTRLPNRFQAPGFAKDLGDVSLAHPATWVRPLVGGAARRALTGSTNAAVQRAAEAYPVRDASQFAPIDRGPPQPPPGMTASPPSAPTAAQGTPAGGFSLADLLSTGVEQPPAQGLSASAPEAPANRGLPFSQNAAHMAGGLELAPETANRPLGDNLSDYPAVASQGVPEGIMARTAQPDTMSLADLISGNRGEGWSQTPTALPPGKRFAGALFRGSQGDVDQLNEAGARFLTPNVAPEEGGTAASDYGPNQKAYRVVSNNMLDAGDTATTANKLGLGPGATTLDIAHAAKAAGYDLVRLKVGNGYEYIHFPQDHNG